MKKIQTWPVALLLLFCLSACAGTQTAAQSSSAPSVSAPAIETPSQTPTETLPIGFTLEVHYIDVGQADAALVLCDGAAMLIDGGNVADSSRIVSYLQRQAVKHLDVIIGTHAHEDHIGGLSGALNVCTVGKVYCPTASYDSDAFRDFFKYVEAQGLSITVPTADESFALGSATVTILGPRQTYADTNNTSIVLRDAGVQVFRTDLQGDIIAASDGKTVTMTTEKTSEAPTNPTEIDGQRPAVLPDAEGYIGNANSKKFHLPTCGSLPDAENRVRLDSYENAIARGFAPCKICLGGL